MIVLASKIAKMMQMDGLKAKIKMIAILTVFSRNLVEPISGLKSENRCLWMRTSWDEVPENFRDIIQKEHVVLVGERNK